MSTPPFQMQVFGADSAARLISAMKSDRTPAGAVLDDVRPDLYRYLLWRHWGPQDGDRCLWVMLNPSIADAERDDHTIRKCIGFAKAWGYAGFEVVNMFSLRSTDKKKLLDAADPIGPKNDAHVLAAAARTHVRTIVCAWGEDRARPGRARAVLDLLKPLLLLADAPTVTCLGTNKDGQPKHPLMLGYKTKLEPFDLRAA